MTSAIHDRHARFAAAAAFAAMLVAGCGGDSGGGGGTTPPAMTTTLSGVASKGLLKNALVSAYGVSASGTVGTTALASTSTNDSGAYSLNIGDYAGTVQIVVSVQSSTTMADEASGNSAVALPSTFTLHANTVVNAPTTANQTQSASVTPYTELAHSIATGLGGVTSANIVNANGVVFKLIGVDPVATVPVASNAAPPANATPAQLRYALFNAAVSQLAAATPTTSDTATQGCYTAAGSDVGKRIQCATTQLAAAVSITGSGSSASAAANTKLSGLAAALVAASASGTANQTGTTIAPTDSYVQTLASQASAAESGTPTPITVAPITQAGTDVATAKLFFSNLRNNAAVLQGSAGSASIVDGMKVFGESLGTDVSSLAVSSGRLISLLRKGQAFWLRYKAGLTTQNTFGVPGTFDGCSIFQGNFPNFNAVALHTPYIPNSVLASSKDNATWLGCSTSSGPLPSDGSKRYRQTILVNLAADSGGWAGTNYTSITRAQYTSNGNTYYENLTTALDGTLALNSDFENGLGIYSIVGKLPPATDASGTLLAAWYPVNFSGTLSQHASGANKIAITAGQLGVVPAGSTAQTLLIDLAVGGQMSAVFPEDDTNAAQVAATEVNWDVAITEPSGKLAGNLLVNQFVLGSGGDLSAGNVKFTGSVAVTPISGGTAGALATWGELTLQVTLSDKLVISFDGKLTLPGQPVLALKGSITKTSDTDATLQAAYTQGALNVTITGTQTATAKSFTFADASGVSVTLTDPGTEAKVTVSGRDTGVIREGSNTVTYSDGSFETVINPGSGG